MRGRPARQCKPAVRALERQHERRATAGRLDVAHAAAHGDEVMRILRELNAEGTTLVMVTHSPMHAAQATRTLRLLDGRVLVDALAA